VNVDDIRDGLRYFTKFGSTLMCSARVGNVKDTNAFITPSTLDATPSTAAEFDTLA